MSKLIREKVAKLFDENLAKRLLKTHIPGSRIAPSKNSRNDKKHEIRLDAGEMVDDRYLNVYLQVNSQATSPTLKQWVQKNGTHANLATGTFDTKATDPGAETQKLLDSLTEEAKENI